MDLHEFVGPNVGSRMGMSTLHICLDEGDISAIVNYAAEMMNTHINCHQLLFREIFINITT